MRFLALGCLLGLAGCAVRYPVSTGALRSQLLAAPAGFASMQLYNDEGMVMYNREARQLTQIEVTGPEGRKLVVPVDNQTRIVLKPRKGPEREVYLAMVRADTGRVGGMAAVYAYEPKEEKPIRWAEIERIEVYKKRSPWLLTRDKTETIARKP